MPSNWLLPPRPTRTAPAGRHGHAGRHPPHVLPPDGTVGHCHAQGVRDRLGRLAASVCRHCRERQPRLTARRRQAPAAAAAGSSQQGSRACTHRCNRHSRGRRWEVAPGGAGRGCLAHRRAHGCHHHHAHRGYGGETTGGRRSRQPQQRRRPQSQQRPPSPQGTAAGARQRRSYQGGGSPSAGRGQLSGCDHPAGQGRPCRHRRRLREPRGRLRGHPPYQREGHLLGKTGVARQLLADPARRAAGDYHGGPGGHHQPTAARRPRDSRAASAKANGHGPLDVFLPRLLAGEKPRRRRPHRRHEGIQMDPLNQGVPHAVTREPHRGA